MISLLKTLRIVKNPCFSKQKTLLFETNFRGLSTTIQKRAVPPILITLVKPASRILAVVLGRRFRRWWKNLPENDREKIKHKTRENGEMIGGLGMFLLGLVFYAIEIHIETCPITGRRKFVALKKNQIEKIGQAEFESMIELNEENILPESHPYYDRVANVSTRLLKSNQDLPEVRTKNWTISVVDSEEENAFVLPTGNIFVYTGMLNACSTDDQLGIVLGHEISHALLNHAGENLTYINFLSALMIIPLAVLWAIVPNDGIAIIADWFVNKASKILLELPFSRQMEEEADEVGLKIASKACFDVREAPLFWAKMQVISQMSDDVLPPEFLSTHPSHEKREATLSRLVPDALLLRDRCGCYRLSCRNYDAAHFGQFVKSMQQIAMQNHKEKPRMVKFPIV